MESTLNLIKNVELATQGQAPTVSKALAMEANVLFGFSDNDGHQQEGKLAKISTGGNVDGSTRRNG